MIIDGGVFGSRAKALMDKLNTERNTGSVLLTYTSPQHQVNITDYQAGDNWLINI